jgi:hypothetical protein
MVPANMPEVPFCWSGAEKAETRFRRARTIGLFAVGPCVDWFDAVIPGKRYIQALDIRRTEIEWVFVRP